MSNQTNTPTMAPPDSGVKVRMYRPHGLGDCFLLAFRAEDGSGRYMLIDCGIFFATKGGSARMKKIARDIAVATGGQLHVLVATHEHWDHLSGFQFAEKIFDSINVEQVWLAWTEDRHHPLAKRLREKHAVALRALTAAVAGLQAADDPGAGTIQEVLNFYGGFDTTLGISGTAGQMTYVHDRVSKPHYCRPEETPLTLPGVPGVRAFVLGPPENEDLLKRLHENTKRFRKTMSDAGFDIKPGEHPIVPIMLYEDKLAPLMADRLLEEGIYVIGFTFPVVPRGEARIRVQISAAHEPEHIDKAVTAFTKIGKELNVI